MLQDLRKAEQRRQTLALGLALFHQLRQIDAQRRLVRVWADADVTEFVNVVVVIAPPGNVIGTQHFAGILVVHCNLLH